MISSLIDRLEPPAISSLIDSFILLVEAAIDSIIDSLIDSLKDSLMIFDSPPIDSLMADS